MKGVLAAVLAGAALGLSSCTVLLRHRWGEARVPPGSAVTMAACRTIRLPGVDLALAPQNDRRALISNGPLGVPLLLEGDRGGRRSPINLDLPALDTPFGVIPVPRLPFERATRWVAARLHEEHGEVARQGSCAREAR